MNSDDEIFINNNFKNNSDLYQFNFLPQINESFESEISNNDIYNFIPQLNESYDSEISNIDEKLNANNFYDDEDKSNQSTGFNSSNPNDSSNQNNKNLKENNYENNNNNKNKRKKLKNKKTKNSNISIENDLNNNILNDFPNNQNQNLVNNKKIKRKDNIRSIIKNKYRNFVFDYVNYNIKEEYKYQKVLFRKPEYKEISGGNKKENKEFFQKKLYEVLLENDISPKYSTKDPEQNKKNLKRFDLNDNSKVSNFLNLTMESIYNNYFLNKKEKIKEILFFDDFIEELKNKNEDERYIEEIKKIAKEDFISYYKNYKKKNEDFLSKKRISFVCIKK